ncbi:MAG: DUF1611 domain-containing protein [Saprospiraceae bacterium]
MIKNALVLTNGMLDTDFAKTCHGLLRGSTKFNIVGIVDENHTGKDPSFAIGASQNLNIPIVKSISHFTEHYQIAVDYAIIGIAVPGGQLPTALEKEILTALSLGISIINGLHTILSQRDDFASLARVNHCEITDIRKPKEFKQLSFWSGQIMKIPIPKIAVLGMDCGVGKRTTCKFLLDRLNQYGLKTQMIYTGQTGWMQGSSFGFILDSTLNDFVSGELEKTILDCFEQTNPQLILIEGQSSLRNPSGPCGSELLLSGNAKGVILQHAPGRKYYEDTNIPLGSVYDEIKLIKLYGSEVIAITLNEENCSDVELESIKQEIQRQTGIPTIRPLKNGVDELIPVIEEFVILSASGRT